MNAPTEFEDAVTRYGVACLNFINDERAGKDTDAALEAIRSTRQALMAQFDAAVLDKAKSLVLSLSSH